MKPTQVLQEIRKMRFEEAYEGWNGGRLTQAEAARILSPKRCFSQHTASYMLRDFELSGFVARNLSGCHIAPGGRYETDTSATGDTKDEIRRSV